MGMQSLMLPVRAFNSCEHGQQAGVLPPAAGKWALKFLIACFLALSFSNGRLICFIFFPAFSISAYKISYQYKSGFRHR